MALKLAIGIGMSLLCLEFFARVNGDSKSGGFPDVKIESECRDRFFWVHIPSTAGALRFEAVDESGVHYIDDRHASRCGYTISTFKMDGYTTLRASYFSCHTRNQNDEVFTFTLNVIITTVGGQWSSHPISKNCSLPKPWSQREVICEENYMEVNVRRDTPCEASQRLSKETWQAAFSLAQRTAASAWQIMFLKENEQTDVLSVNDAHQLGYSLHGTTKGVVLRSRYGQPQSEMVMVEGVLTELLQGTIFFRQQLMVVMIDISMACTKNSGYFDGERLFWEVPRVMGPLLSDNANFQSKSLHVGVEGQLLDKVTAQARGFNVEYKGAMVEMSIPFGAEGGYRTSSVVNNVYKEMYVIYFTYEHIFSLVYNDGSSVETRHRLLRVVDTPLRCQRPFIIDQTIQDEYVFTVYLGNIPYDVNLVGVEINDKQFSAEKAAAHGYSLSKTAHANSTHAYVLKVPFEDEAVQRMYLGEGLLQYSMDLNYTLNILPQQDAYYYYTSVVVQLPNAYPPELNAECTETGITFSMIKQPRLGNLWELEIDQELLTPELAAQRGYVLQNESDKFTLEVPVFSLGYIYEDINLKNFYGTFKVITKDSRRLEIQSSISKRCPFKTERLIVCSTDGIMTVVATPTMTWPMVDPRKTTLLDRGCRPKETDKSRALFQFSLNTCGTRVMVGDSFVVYENEILHDRELIRDGGSFISRDSKFKFTVRCFYPLSAITKLFVDRIFRSKTAGFGSIKVFESTKDTAHDLPIIDCPLQAPGNQNQATNGFEPFQSEPWPKPKPSNFVQESIGNHKFFPATHASIYGSTASETPTYNQPAPEIEEMVPQLIQPQYASLGLYDASKDRDASREQIIRSQTESGFPGNPSKYTSSQDYTAQQRHVNIPNIGSIQVGSLGGGTDQTDNNPINFYTLNRNPYSPHDLEQSELDTTGQSVTGPSTLSSAGSLAWADIGDSQRHTSTSNTGTYTSSTDGHLQTTQEKLLYSNFFGGSERLNSSANEIYLPSSISFQQTGADADSSLYPNSQYEYYQTNIDKYEHFENSLLGGETIFQPPQENDAMSAVSHYSSSDSKTVSMFSQDNLNNELTTAYQFPNNQPTGPHQPTSINNPGYEIQSHYDANLINNDKLYHGANSNVHVFPDRNQKYIPTSYINAGSKIRDIKPVPAQYVDTQPSSFSQNVLQSPTQSQSDLHSVPQHIAVKPISVQPVQPVESTGPQTMRVKTPSQFPPSEHGFQEQHFTQHLTSESHSAKQPNLNNDSHQYQSQYGYWSGRTQMPMDKPQSRNNGSTMRLPSSAPVNVNQDASVLQPLLIRPAPTLQRGSLSSITNSVKASDGTQEATTQYYSGTHERQVQPAGGTSLHVPIQYKKVQGDVEDSSPLLQNGLLNIKIKPTHSRLPIFNIKSDQASETGVVEPSSGIWQPMPAQGMYPTDRYKPSQPLRFQPSANKTEINQSSFSQQSIKQHNNLVHNVVDSLSLRNIIQPVRDSQDVQEPATNLYAGFQPNNEEGTSPYASSIVRRESASKLASSGILQARPGQDVYQTDRSEPLLSQLSSSKQMYSGGSRTDSEIDIQPLTSNNERSYSHKVKLENSELPVAQPHSIGVTKFHGNEQRPKVESTTAQTGQSQDNVQGHINQYRGPKLHAAELRPSPDTVPSNSGVGSEDGQRRGVVTVRVKPTDGWLFASQENVHQPTMYGGSQAEPYSDHSHSGSGTLQMKPDKAVLNQHISGNTIPEIPFDQQLPPQRFLANPSPNQHIANQQLLNKYKNLVNRAVDGASLKNVIRPVSDHSSSTTRKSNSKEQTTTRLQTRPESSKLAAKSRHGNLEQQNVNSFIGGNVYTQALRPISKPMSSARNPSSSSVHSMYGTGTTTESLSQAGQVEYSPTSYTYHNGFTHDGTSASRKQDENPEEQEPNRQGSHEAMNRPAQTPLYQIQVPGDCSKSGVSPQSDKMGTYGTSVHEGILRG